jgi:hypothetical protein
LWKARNAAVHARDELGLKVQAGQELEMAINLHFKIGISGLLLQDKHLITQGRDKVDQMSTARKKAWLQHIIIAREILIMTWTRKLLACRIT